MERGVVTKTSCEDGAGEGEAQALLPGLRYAFYTVYHHHQQEVPVGGCPVFQLQSLTNTICSPFVAEVI